MLSVSAWLWHQTAPSRSTISRATEEIERAFGSWRDRSPAGEEVVNLFLETYYQGVRLGSKEKEPILVAHGITRPGKRALLGVCLGCRESAQSWKLALPGVVGRGLPNRSWW